MTTLARFSLAGLGVVLDLPPTVAVRGVGVMDGTVALELDGVYLDETEPAEVVASYEVDVTGHRRFIGFRLPDSATPLTGDSTFTDLSTMPVTDEDARDAEITPQPAAAPAKKKG